MSFEALAQQITNELVADLKTHRHLRQGWDQIEHADRARIIDQWRALILAALVSDGEKVIQRYATRGFDSEQAITLAGEAVKTLIRKEMSEK